MTWHANPEAAQRRSGLRLKARQAISGTRASGKGLSGG
jgi:hypothetical protein